MQPKKDLRPRLTRLTYLFASVLFLVLLALGTQIGIAWGEEDAAPESEASTPARVELAGTRSETSNTYRLPSGALQTELFTGPVNYETEKGDWAPIDEDLEDSPEGGLSNGAASFELHLPEQLDSGAVRISEDSSWVSYRLLGASSEEAEVEGPEASYEAEGGKVTFNLTSLASGLKEAIVLNDPSAPHSYRFALDASTGLSPSLTEDGSVQFRDGDEHLFATIPAPTISDSQSEGELVPRQGPVGYSLSEGSEGNWILSLDVDEQWLSDPERKFPVTIDPTIAVAQMTDCMISNTPSPNGTS